MGGRKKKKKRSSVDVRDSKGFSLRKKKEKGQFLLISPTRHWMAEVQKQGLMSRRRSGSPGTIPRRRADMSSPALVCKVSARRWKLMTRLHLSDSVTKTGAQTCQKKKSPNPKKTLHFDLTKVGALRLRCTNFSCCSSVIFTFEWCDAHLYLRAPREGERGYFDKMYLKAAYFQTNHSPAPERGGCRSHARKKYFGNAIINKFY